MGKRLLVCPPILMEGVFVWWATVRRVAHPTWLSALQFDSRNRLVQAGNTSYRYDAENQRIGVNQTNYVINSQPALSQVLVKEENGIKTFYVYGLGLIGEETNGQYWSYHFDYRGSTVALTNENGQVTQRFQYAPYGELVSGDATQTPFLFNGMYGVMTDENNLYYMRARFYSPDIKRFVNQDILLGSIVEGQTLNRFAFVTGNPVSFVDPFGLEKFLTESEIQELFKKMAGLDLAFDKASSGCEARAHLMAKEILKLDYVPYKVWAISFDNKLAVKGRENEGLQGWGFHVSIMVKSGDNPDSRWVIDPALFLKAVGVDEWKNLLSGWDNTSESKFGERPLINNHGSYQQLPGSYAPFIPDSEFPYYFLGIKIRGTIDEEANQAICTKKKENFLSSILSCW